jgi:hypothetical protein
MRITVHAAIENADGSSAPQVVEIGEVTRDAGVHPASGLGLFVREANALLRQIQSVVLNEQADEFIRVAAGCLACGRRLGIKNTKPLVYRTVYGKAVLRSPRFYSLCGACGFMSGDGPTVSPLAHVELGCHEGQALHWAPALPSEAFLEFATKRRSTSWKPRGSKAAASGPQAVLR